MSDYTVTTDFSVKDALSAGDPNKLIKGSDIDVEFDAIAVAIATKPNEVASPVANNLIKQDASGHNLDASSISDDGTTVAIATGRFLNVVDAGGLKLAGVAVTSTAAEINLLDGVTQLWHTGNDGAGSGLDADLLDAQHGSYYTNATNLSSGTVPSARLPAATTTVVGALETATQAEADAGTATDKIITPSTLMNRAGLPVQQSYTLYTTQATGTTTIPVDSTIPQNTEGDEFITASITPKSTSNLLKIEAKVCFGVSGADFGIMALFQDTTANALAADASYHPGGGQYGTMHIIYWMTAGTTSSTTFKIRCGGGSGNIYINRRSSGATDFGGVLTSSLTITEYAV